MLTFSSSESYMQMTAKSDKNLKGSRGLEGCTRMAGGIQCPAHFMAFQQSWILGVNVKEMLTEVQRMNEFFITASVQGPWQPAGTLCGG